MGEGKTQRGGFISSALVEAALSLIPVLYGKGESNRKYVKRRKKNTEIYYSQKLAVTKWKKFISKTNQYATLLMLLVLYR